MQVALDLLGIPDRVLEVIVTEDQADAEREADHEPGRSDLAAIGAKR